MDSLTVPATEMAKREICKKVERMVSYPIVGLSDILSILTSPDVLPLLQRYISEKEHEFLEG